MNKEVREFITRLRKIPGVSVSTRGRHPKVYLDGSLVSTLPSSPSDIRWRLNSITELRQKGIDVKGFKEEKRLANGQTPPPLPIISKEASMPEAKATPSTAENAAKMANKVVKAIEDHYAIPTRKGRVIGHGASTRLTQILFAHEQDTGNRVPNRDYKKHYDVNDRKAMAKLAAERVTAVASEARGAKRSSNNSGDLTKKTVEIVVYANKAWKWFVDRSYELPEGTTVDELSVAVEDPETIETFEQVMGEPWLPPVEVAATNGNVNGDDLDSVLQAVALMGQSGNTDEAARLGRKLYEAIGR